MPITQVDIDDATKLIEELLGDQDEAEAYSKDPEGWLTEHGYEGLNPEAVAQCGASYGGGAAVAHSSAAAASASASAGASAVAAVLDPVVYNHYYEVDNSITNNIVNNGNLEFDQTIGDGNVNIEDTNVAGDLQVQTGDGIQVGGDVDDSNLNTGDDVQQAIDQSTNIDADIDVDVDSHDVVGSPGAVSTDASTDVNVEDVDLDG